MRGRRTRLYLVALSCIVTGLYLANVGLNLRQVEGRLVLASVYGASMEPSVSFVQFGFMAHRSVDRWEAVTAARVFMPLAFRDVAPETPRPPQRGDIILYEWADRPGHNAKRIVGLPGETVAYRGTTVLVNGVALTEPYTNGPVEIADPPTVLGPDEYYVLGDNRAMVYDSRLHGPVKERRIVGRLWFAFFPLHRFGPIVTPEYPLQG